MAGVEETGFVRKLQAQCVGEIIAEARSTVDTEYDDSPDSVTGGLATIVGAKHAELWEVLEAVYASLSPYASGIGLDRVMAYSNSKRKPATATLLSVTLTGSDGSYAPGAVDLTVDGQDVHFSNRDTLVIAGGTGTGVFACDTVGPVRVAGGTLGPDVTSFDEVSVGTTIEADPLARVRRLEEIADEGTSTVPALKAALSKLENVQSVRVYSNRSMSVDSGGRPAKSIEALVLVYDDSPEALQPIADTIWANLPAGIEAWGVDQLLDVTDEEGHTQQVGFSTASGVDLHARVIAVIDPSTYPGDDAIKATVHDFTAGLTSLNMGNGNVIAGGYALGARVYRDVIAAAARSVPGVLSITAVELSPDAVTWTAADHTLTPRQYLGTLGARGFQLPNIVVVTVEGA
jgi:hypothetical protein